MGRGNLRSIPSPPSVVKWVLWGGRPGYTSQTETQKSGVTWGPRYDPGPHKYKRTHLSLGVWGKSFTIDPGITCLHTYTLPCTHVDTHRVCVGSTPDCVWSLLIERNRCAYDDPTHPRPDTTRPTPRCPQHTGTVIRWSRDENPLLPHNHLLWGGPTSRFLHKTPLDTKRGPPRNRVSVEEVVRFGR